MKLGFVKKQSIPISIVILAAVAFLLVWLSPAEKTLGSYVGLVYTHGALTWVGLVIYASAGLLGFAHLVSGRNLFYLWSSATQRTAILIWGCNILLGILGMRLVWGGIIWSEPRLVGALLIFLLSVGVYLIAASVERAKVTSALNLSVAVALWASLMGLRKVFHPVNPIRGSLDPMIKISFGTIVLIFLLISIQITRWIHKGLRNDLPS